MVPVVDTGTRRMTTTGAVGRSRSGATSRKNVSTPVASCVSVAMTDTDSRPASAAPGVPANASVSGSNVSHAGNGEPSSSVAL